MAAPKKAMPKTGLKPGKPKPKRQDPQQGTDSMFVKSSPGYRPQLDKMGAGRGTVRNKLTYRKTEENGIIGYRPQRVQTYASDAEARNAEYAYRSNPANRAQVRKEDRAALIKGYMSKKGGK